MPIRCHSIALSALLITTFISLRADPLIIPHLADDSGWRTTLVLTNTSSSPAAVTLLFHRETANGATEPWSPAFVEVSGTSNLTVPGGGSLFLHTTGTSPSGSVGWGEVQTTGAVQAYAVFTSSATQDGTAPASVGASRLLVPFDNTGGRFTALALATNSTTGQTVSVSIRTNDGTITKGTLGTLPTAGHTSFLLASKFPATASQQGLVELSSSVGSLSGIALRFNANGAFTSAPMYPQSGSPIIGVAPGSVQVTGVTFASSSLPSGGSAQGNVTLNAAAPSGGASVTLQSSSAALTVPASVTVSAGATSASFIATAGSVSADQAATISASYGGNTAQATLTVTAAPPGTTVSFGSLLSSTLTYQPVGYSSSLTSITCTPDAGNIVITCTMLSASGTTLTIKGSSSDHGTTFVFDQVDNTFINIAGLGGTPYTIISANFSFSLSPGGASAFGTLDGTLTMTVQPYDGGAAFVVTGEIKGGYILM